MKKKPLILETSKCCSQESLEREKMRKLIHKNISLLNHLSLQIVKRKSGEDMETVFSGTTTATIDKCSPEEAR